jgi:hypothetical protein
VAETKVVPHDEERAGEQRQTRRRERDDAWWEQAGDE